MIIQRYILRLVAAPFFFISVLITVLLLAEAFGDVITRTLGGSLPGYAVVTIIMYQVPGVLEELMPGALFLAMVLTLSQLGASSERTVLQAVGFSDNRLLGLMVSVSALVAGFLLLLSLWIVPWSARQVADLERELAARPAAELVQPGEFAQIDRRGTTLYAQNMDTGTGELLDVFLAWFGDDEQLLVTADRAQVVQQDGGRYLRLAEGETIDEWSPNELIKTQFDSLLLRLDLPTPSTSRGRNEMSLSELLDSDNLRNITDAQQRFLYPLTVIVFAFWSVALTRNSTRGGKNAAVLPAIVFYVIYMYLMRTVNGMVRAETLPVWANYWWLHGVAIGFAMLLRLNWSTPIARVRNRFFAAKSGLPATRRSGAKQ